MSDWRSAPFQPLERILYGHPDDTDADCERGHVVRPWELVGGGGVVAWHFDIQLDNGTALECVDVSWLRKADA